MGINNIDVLVAEPEEPKKPRCTRCNIEGYEGEISIKFSHGENWSRSSFSLCGFCLPIVRDRLIGFVEDQMNVTG